MLAGKAGSPMGPLSLAWGEKSPLANLFRRHVDVAV